MSHCVARPRSGRRSPSPRWCRPWRRRAVHPPTHGGESAVRRGSAGRARTARRRAGVPDHVHHARCGRASSGELRSGLRPAGHSARGWVAGVVVGARHGGSGRRVRALAESAQPARRELSGPLAVPGVCRRGDRLHRARHPGRPSLSPGGLRGDRGDRHGARGPGRGAGAVTAVDDDRAVAGRARGAVHRARRDSLCTRTRLPRRRHHRRAVEPRDGVLDRRTVDSAPRTGRADGVRDVHFRRDARDHAAGRRRQLPHPARQGTRRRGRDPVLRRAVRGSEGRVGGRVADQIARRNPRCMPP